MKSNTLSKVLVLALALVTLGNSTVFAAPINKTSDANVAIEAGTTTSPEEGEEPGGNETDPSDSSFKFFLWPSDFTFKTAKASSSSQDIDVNDSFDRYVAVADQRGTLDGYEVTAQMTEFAEGLTENKLVGAKIKWAQSAVSFPDPTKPTTVPAVPETDGNIVAATDILLDSTSAKKILKAPKGKGQGYFGVKFASNGLKLVLPGNEGKAGKSYTSTITWSLNDVPTA